MRIILLCIALLPATVLSGTSWAQPAAGEPQVVRESRFDIADAPAVAEVVQQVVDFPPGAWTSPHSHGGQAINLVMTGEITFREGTTERKYSQGESWSDATGQVHAAGNSTEAQAHLLTNFLLPDGATQTTVAGGSNKQPSVVHEARFPIAALPAGADIVQQAIDFEPGAWTSPRKHGGQAVHIVVSGEVAYQADGRERVYKAGEAWQDAPGHIYATGNKGTGKSRLFITVLLPDNAELTVAALAAEFLPVVQDEPAGFHLSNMLIFSTLVLLLLTSGFLLVRRSRTR